MEQSATFLGEGPYQLGEATSGVSALASDRRAGIGTGTYDIDGGTTIARSPEYALPSNASRIGMQYYFAHRSNTTSDDRFTVTVISGNSRTLVFSVIGTPTDRPAAWGPGSFDVSPWAGQNIQLEFAAGDEGTASLIEVAIDDLSLTVQ